jgi:hypothetical protein
MGAAMATARLAAPSLGRVLPDTWYDWLVVLSTGWLITGAYLDNWAHGHVLKLDTFFTPYHGVLYSGFALVGVVIVGRWVRERSLPEGYKLSLIGCGLFALAGIGDMLWHTIFGIERQLAAVLSPSHLGLIATMGLIVTGPLRAVQPVAGRRAPFVFVACGVVVLAYMDVATSFAQPFVQRMAALPTKGVIPYNEAVELGLFGVMLQSALLVGLVVKMRERFELPFGSLTLMVGIVGFALGAATNLDFMVLVAVVGGLAGDLWLLVLRDRPGVFGFAFPATLFALYVLSLQIVYGTWWEIHAITGIVAVAGLTGLLVTAVMRRPEAALATA